jgi:hypothetical protein
MGEDRASEPKAQTGSTLVELSGYGAESRPDAPYPRGRGVILSTPARIPRSPAAERDLGGILRLARRGWWIIVVAAVAGAVGLLVPALLTGRSAVGIAAVGLSPATSNEIVADRVWPQLVAMTLSE